MRSFLSFALFGCFLVIGHCIRQDPPSGLYEVSDDLGLGRRFDGIGGLSGGGVRFNVAFLGDVMLLVIILYFGDFEIVGQLCRAAKDPNFGLLIQGKTII